MWKATCWRRFFGSGDGEVCLGFGGVLPGTPVAKAMLGSISCGSKADMEKFVCNSAEFFQVHLLKVVLNPY